MACLKRSNTMKVVLLLTMVMTTPIVVFGNSPASKCLSLSSALLDTSETDALQDSSGAFHWVNVDLMLGRQYLSEKWEPYPTATFLAFSWQRRLGGSPLWLDVSLCVTWAGEFDAEGRRARAGTSLVQMQSGLGHRWFLEHFPLSFYAGGRLTHVWAKLTLPDKSKPSQINPAFPDRLIYPDMSQEGHFLGGTVDAGLSII